MRAVPHARAQLRHLALPDPSVRGKRHESAMDSAMRPWPPSADPHLWENASGRQAAAPLPPSAQLSFSSVWREARLSVPGAHVRASKDALAPVRLHRAHSLCIPWACSKLAREFFADA